jgi:hypothetical protein
MLPYCDYGRLLILRRKDWNSCSKSVPNPVFTVPPITEPTIACKARQFDTPLVHYGLFSVVSDDSDPTTLCSNSDQCEVCPSCSTSTALATVITAIATALLATVIFVLVQIAVCKYHPKFTPGGAETGISAGGGGGGNAFQLKENEAYASTTH